MGRFVDAAVCGHVSWARSSTHVAISRKAIPAAVALALLSGFVSGCGGGSSKTGTGGGGGGTTGTPPSSLSYPVASAGVTLGIGLPITPLTPTVTGTVTSYSESPALPVGLSLNAGTGVISGTPTALSSAASYTITASNSAGSTTASIKLQVVLTAPDKLVYPQTTINATVGQPIAADVPTVVGQVSGYSVSPALPAGLMLDSSTGAISGTPSAPSAQAAYTVKAANASGSTTAQVTIAVAGAKEVLFEGGHQSAIVSLHSNIDRLLSSDNDGHWILWNFLTGALIAEGDEANQSDLEGQVYAVSKVNGIDIRSAQDGSLIANAPDASVVSLPSDGSYVCTAGSTKLTVWSPSGSAESTHPGDYSKAVIFAASGKVQVANGAAGQNVIETIDVPSGTSTMSPTFQGTFQFWFGDGGKFATQLSNVYWVYSSTATQLAMATTPSGIDSWNGGAGNWLWSESFAKFNVFAFGASAPTQTFQLPTDNYGNLTFSTTGTTVAVLNAFGAHMSLVDLSGPTPSISTMTLPAVEIMPTTYTKNASGEFAVGSGTGVVVDPTNAAAPLYFDDGEVTALAAGGDTAAVATARGRTLLYSIGTGQKTGTINEWVDGMIMSSDGTVLAARNGNAGETVPDSIYFRNSTLTVYSLPSRAVIHSFPHPVVDQELIFFSLSGSGTVVGQTSGFSISRVVTGVSGTPVIWSDNLGGPTQLSPDGSLIAAPGDLITKDYSTWIYKNGVPVTKLMSARSAGWIDNNHLFVTNFLCMPMGCGPTGNSIYDATGTLVKSLPAGIPFVGDSINSAQFPTSDLIFVPEKNAIYSLTTGSVAWQGATPVVGMPTGVAVGSNVIELVNRQVVVLPTQ